MRTPLQQNEKILLTTYTSWVMLVLPVVILVAALMLAIYISIGTWFLILVLPALGYLGWKYFEWKHNIWVVTNFRVIDEFGVFNINTRESPLDKINNVSYQQTIWGRILGFGNVEIQTAATIGETVYNSVDKPKLLKDTITNAQANYKHVQTSMHIKDIMSQMQPQPPAQQQPTTYTQQPPAQTTYSPSTYVSQPPSQHKPEPSFNQQIASELEKLFDLKQKGILSEDEYQRAKARLLG